MACKDWDEGWCYAEGTKYISGCVGEDNCEYTHNKVIPRIDIIGQNGNDGSIYLVEKIARTLAGNDADMKLMGKNAGKVRWQVFVPMAIKVLDIIEEHENEN